MSQPTSNRLLSLDFFRGITMFFLAAEGAWLYDHLKEFEWTGIAGSLVTQFHHHPWNGLMFWDLIQPFFMLIVGVAMPYSYQARIKKGQSRQQINRHIIQRCLLLLGFGVLLHCGYSHKLVWELWNVLSQLSVTIAIAYLLMNLRLPVQFGISLILIAVTEIAYRVILLPGFDQPFVMGHNFGSFMDTVLMGKINDGGWVAINAIPTAAHTIWGVIVGKLLMDKMLPTKKLRVFLIAGFSMLVVGYGLDYIGITPIIKRICTSSFVLASGGWAILALSLCYWLIDLKGRNKRISLFIIFGTNPIFIYIFFNTVGGQWFNNFVQIFTQGLFGWLIASELWIKVINSLAVLALETGLLYWMYRRKIFFKI